MKSIIAVLQPGLAPFADLEALLATLHDEVVLVDFRDQILDREAIDPLAALHAGWRRAGLRLIYAAQIPVTRGMCVAAMHRAGDLEGQVIADPRPTGAVGRVPAALSRLDLHIHAAHRPSTLATRLVSEAAGAALMVIEGYRQPFLEEVFRTFGIAGAVALGEAVERVIAALTRRWGEPTAQILVAFASQGRGCPHCSFGYMYAANLMLFKATGALGPIDEREMVLSLGWTDAKTRAFVHERLSGSPWSDALDPLTRLFALRDGASLTEDGDPPLLDLLAAWSLVNECSLQIRIGEVPPLHPGLTRDRRLQRAYREARSDRESPFRSVA